MKLTWLLKSKLHNLLLLSSGMLNYFQTTTGAYNYELRAQRPTARGRLDLVYSRDIKKSITII